jgi:hypothetical protein
LAWSLAHTPLIRIGAGASVFYVRLFCQFAAVLLGVWINGVLSKVFTRKEAVRLDLESPEASSNSSLIGHAEEQACKSVTDLAPEVGK